MGLVLYLLYSSAVFKQGGMIYWGGTVYYIRYTIFTSFPLFVHYTGIYTGWVVVLARLFPTRVDTSCGGLYLLYLTYCLSSSY